jgi:hypothetical protein
MMELSNMVDMARVQRMLDEYEIFGVRRRWAYSRDHQDWETLKTCFHPDATVVVSWFEGTATEFVEQTKKAAAARKPEERSAHALGNYDVTIRGDRAILEADMYVLNRDYLDGILFDSICYGRFYDMFERRNDEWRIAKWTCIYDKDRLDPVLPVEIPTSFYGALKFEGEENGFALMRLRQEKKGRTVPAGLTMGGMDSERRLKREGDEWLSGG